ncbi:ABC transporter permease [Marinoscillum pacificum]|uniref:ABC transporter permease n=1 Tax=Marinoscillum pacificum TaxID=392723 RepID=UPI0021585E09|nr:ABC transporter permease [Marinoscillum pacificum]
MLYQYLFASWRNLIKHRLHSFLNVIGLAVGLGACLTIAAYVHYELSYDLHHPDVGNTYRIALNRIYPNQEKNWAAIAPIVPPTVTDDLPEVESYTRIMPDMLMIAPEGEKLEEQSVTMVDSGFFDLFHAPIVKGEISSEFFRRKDGMILTKSVAEKYFQDENPIGQVFNFMLADTRQPMVVTAVIEDPLPNSHFSYEILCSVEGIHPPEWIMKSWGTWAMYGYIKVHEGTNPLELAEKINKISEAHQGEGDSGYQAWLDAGNYYRYFLQPITDIHLTSNLRGEFEANSSEFFVYFFAIVGVFILLMAVVNFINLATARASHRTLEIGIRKTVGASRGDLMIQFLIESTVISFIALLIALPLTQLFIPYFNQVIGKSISLEFFTDPVAALVLITSPVLLGFLAGIYPALYLSNFGPSSIFQKLMVRHGKQRIRHVLVIGQLCIAVILIAGTTTVYRQMHYITTKPLGFDKDQLISIGMLPFSDDRIDVFRTKAMEISGVSEVAVTSFPVDGIRTGMAVRNVDEAENWVNMNCLSTDEYFIPTMGLELIAGRNLRSSEIERSQEPSTQVILNRTGVKYLGWTPEEAIGKVLMDGDNSLNIIGVVEDFNLESLHQPVGPFIIESKNYPDKVRSLAIRLNPRDMQESIAALGEVWAMFAPDQLFSFNYLDESMAQYYEAEKLTGKLFILFSMLAIFICCLGLFGLMGFVVERRAKEVGIRKVMGANISQIMILLSKDYIKLVVISSAIAIPLAWWGLGKWLDNFAFRIDNSVFVLILAGVAVMIISWITVTFYAYKSAVSNPVNSLRSE